MNILLNMKNASDDDEGELDGFVYIQFQFQLESQRHTNRPYHTHAVPSQDPTNHQPINLHI